MTLSEKRFELILNSLLCLICGTIFFMKVCTIFIIIFSIFNFFFYKRLEFNKQSLVIIACIASPFLLHFLFFFNDNSLISGVKAAEKTVSLLLFPLFIIGNKNRINFNVILKFYMVTALGLLFFFFIAFVIYHPELINKYLKGIHLWEMGYKFANFLGVHAPALNMQLSFVSICFFYFFIKNIRSTILIPYLLGFAIMFFFILFINTRMGLLNTLLGVLIITIYYIINQENKKKAYALLFLFIGIISISLFMFTKANPYMIKKYTKVTFSNLDKIGKLDEIENPESKAFNSLVTRVSIWKSATELSVKNLPFGVGASDGKKELFNYYKETNQMFLYKYKFPVHNQYIDFLLKFGVLGLLVVFLYVFNIGYIGVKLNEPIIIVFFIIFAISNLTDDFLIRFDGIVFSGFWVSLFASVYCNKESL